MAMSGAGADELERRYAPLVPLGRIGRKFECAMAAVFLVTQEYISGHTLVVDGAEWIYSGPRPFPAAAFDHERTKETEDRKRSMGPDSKL